MSRAPVRGSAADGGADEWGAIAPAAAAGPAMCYQGQRVHTPIAQGGAYLAGGVRATHVAVGVIDRDDSMTEGRPFDDASGLLNFGEFRHRRQSPDCGGLR